MRSLARAVAGVAAAVLLFTLAVGLEARSSGAPASGALPDEARVIAPMRLTTTPALPAPASAPEAAPAQQPPPGLLAGHRICLDPGHDARWVPGASGRTLSGRVPVHPADDIPLVEHELTLSVAYRLRDLLEDAGALVCVTRKPRSEGGGLQAGPYDYTGDGRVRTAGESAEDGPERIQPRVDWANLFGAEVLVSVHFNGLDDPSVRGTEAYYTDAGPHRDDGKRLATRLIAGLLAEMRSAGYQGIDRGARSDAYQRYSLDETRRMFANNASVIRANGADPADCPACYRLLTNGNNPMSLHQGTYLGVLVEVDFLSNPGVVESFFLRPDSLDVIARGLFQGLRSYFGVE